MTPDLFSPTALAGRVALVTGASSGLGRHFAATLARHGADVVLAARRTAELAALANELAATGRRAHVVAMDVRDAGSVDAAVAAAVTAAGRLDILVNNAGGARAFLEGSSTIPDDAWHASFALNLFAAIRLTNAVLPALRASEVAAIVNISSAAAAMPFGPFAHYGAAKAALEYYSRTLAMELAPNGIRVNAVSPGVTATPGSEEFSKSTPGFSPDDWLRNIPLGRLGATEDIAEVVALLVSDRGKFLTGANYRVDGGMTAR